MKNILYAMVDSIEQLGIHIAAIEGSLIADGHLDSAKVEMSKQVALYDVRQKLESLRSAIARLPNDRI